MKANVEKRVGLAVLGLFVGLNGLPVHAGAVYKPGVYMYDKIVNGAGAYYAEGSMVGARDSADNKQYIGCYSFKLATGGAAVKCVAENTEGRYLFCTGYSAKWAEPVKAMTSSSFVQFATASANGTIVSPFFAKPEMDPSDFRSKKLATLYAFGGLRSSCVRLVSVLRCAAHSDRGSHK